jgi:hypothetical protein
MRDRGTREGVQKQGGGGEEDRREEEKRKAEVENMREEKIRRTTLQQCSNAKQYNRRRGERQNSRSTVFKKAEECVLYANNVPLGHRKKLEGRTREEQKARRLALKASGLYDQRSYSQTNYYSESKSFALSCSQSRICLVFTPGL